MKKENPQISVIVPVYNVEKYLPCCIDSILAQTFTDFELLLVDDGSQDASGEICDRYAAANCHVRVIHKQNQGVSIARNVGLEVCRGEYVMFVDADDVLFGDHCLQWLRGIMNDNTSVDLIKFRCTQHVSPNCMDSSFRYHIVFLNEFIHRKESYVTVWGFMFKSDIIKKENIRFTEGIKYGEDQEFVSKYLLYISQIAITENVFYYHRLVATSAMGKGISVDSFDTFMRIKRLVVYYDSHPNLSSQRHFFHFTIRCWMDSALCYMWKYSFFRQDLSKINNDFKTIVSDAWKAGYHRTVLRLGKVDIRLAVVSLKIRNLIMKRILHHGK